MRRTILYLLAILALLLGAGPAQAQTGYVKFEQVTVSTTPVGFTASAITPNGLPAANIANCTLEGADIRYVIDGTTTVSSSVGTPWPAGTPLVFSGHDIMVNFRAIRSGGSNGTLNCTYTSVSGGSVQAPVTPTGGSGSSGSAGSVTINDPSVTTQKAAVNGSGQLSITCANCSGSGASAVDEAVFTQGTNSVAPAGILFKAAYTALTTGQAGVLRGTSDGAGYINLDKIQGTNADVNSGNKSAGTLRVVLATDQPQLTASLKVDGSAVTQPISGTVSANQGTAGAANWLFKLMDAAGNARGLNVDASNRIGVLADMGTGWPTTVTEAAALAGGATIQEHAAFLYGFDGATYSRVRTRAGLIGASDIGIVTRPFAASDGTNTMPLMDTPGRAGFHKLTDGTNTATVNGSGQLSMTCSNCSGSGASAVDGSAFTQGTNSTAPAGILFKTNYTALTTGQTGILRGFSDGSLYAMGNIASGVADTGNPLKVGGVYNLSAPTFSNGQRGDMQLDASGNLKVNVTTSTFNVATWNGGAIASADANGYLLGATAATQTTTGSASTCYLTSAASTNATNCKASAGNLYAIHITNTTTTNYFLRLYNLAAAPTCSSSTGFIETIPALGASANGGVNGRSNPVPQAFTTGIGFCLTGGGGSTDNTAAATGVYITLEYK